MNKDTYDLLEELRVSIKEELKCELMDSEWAQSKLRELYKKAMSNIYFHITLSEDGRLALYVSPDDDTDIGATIGFERELREWCMVDEKAERNDESSTYTLDLVNSFYKDRELKQ